MSDQHISVCDH